MTQNHLALIAAVFVTALTTSAAAAPSTVGNAEVVATVQAVIEAGQSGDMSRLRRQYAPGCIFVDEFAPFLWTGPEAIGNYFASGARMYQQTQHKGDKVTAAPPAFVYVAADSAFVVEPLSGSATVRGRPYASRGAYAFSLARVDGVWRITSQTWTKASETRDPY